MCHLNKAREAKQLAPWSVPRTQGPRALGSYAGHLPNLAVVRQHLKPF